MIVRLCAAIAGVPSLGAFVYSNTNNTNTNTNLGAHICKQDLKQRRPRQHGEKQQINLRALVPKGKTTYKAKA
jgi:hypothetical protein